MATIFPGSASVNQEFNGYRFNGTTWDIIGQEYNPTVYSANQPVDGKAGDIWIDSSIDVEAISPETILTINSASALYLTKTSASTTYATKTELNNIDALPSQSGNAGKYLTTSGSAASWSTIDLTSAINTASAAAVTYLVDSAPGTLDTLNELAAALGDDANFASTVTTSLGNKLNISTASATYATQSYVNEELSNIDLTEYLTNSSASSIYVAINNMSATPVYIMNSGGSAQRPVSASVGMFRFNTDNGEPEFYSASQNSWNKFSIGPGILAEYLIVAGGAGGGSDQGGGGGAGGYIYGNFNVLRNTSYSIIVGSGGAGGNGAARGVSGTDSSISSVTSAVGGGGGGGLLNRTGASGGSGGGGGSQWDKGSAAIGGSGTVGQGNSGGNGSIGASTSSGGGGGGAGAVGTNANTSGERGGNGGSGLSNSISGSSIFYSGGGGGGSYQGAASGDGGSSIGGKGLLGNTGGVQSIHNGVINRGSGGGGGYGDSGIAGGNGSSGIVIIRYPGQQVLTGGTSVVSSGGYTVHTFTSSGTLTT